jgi:arylsulfatase
MIFASDNGSAGGDLVTKFNGAGPFRGRKGTLYEGGLRVPMIARWPGTVAPGGVSDHVSAFQDVMPTLAELAGVTVAAPTDGVSMVPTLLGRRQQRRHEYLYWELKDNRAVRMGDWKAVRTRKGLELFNLQDDVAE